MKVSKKFFDCKYILFLGYNLTYTTCMLGKTTQALYFLFLAGFIAVCILEYFKRTNGALTGRSFFYKEWKSIMGMYFLLAVISIVFQLINHDFQIYLFKDLIYLIVPPIFAFFWINVISKDDRKKYLYAIFFRYSLQFLLDNIGNLNLAAIRAISWNDTKSSVFESSYAHDFLILEVLFLCMKKKSIAFICWILCLLSFKRLSFILSSIIYIVYCLIQLRNSAKNRKITVVSYEKLRKYISVLIAIVFIASAYLMQWLAIEGGAEIITSRTNFDIQSFMTGRIELIRAAYNNIPHFNGLGTIINYFENSIYRDLGNMHCDVLRLLWETTSIGVSIFAIVMSKNFYKNWAILFSWGYLAMVTITSHALHAFTTWIIFYMLAAILSGDRPENAT